MSITTLITPDRSSATFVTDVDDFFANKLPAFGAEANALGAAMTLNATTGASASSVAIGTGSKSFTADTGKSWQPGMYLVIADTAAPSTNSMLVQVTSYNSGTGALVVNSLSVMGSGTKTAWTISQNAALLSTFDPGSLKSTSGYQKLSSGIIIQWGSVVTSAGGSGAVTFPIAFPTGFLNGSATLIASTPTAYIIGVGGGSTTGMTVYSSTTGGAGVASNNYWMAIGY